MRKIFLSLIFSLLLPLVAGAKLYGPVFMSLNKENGIYTKGEKAVIYARTDKPGEALQLIVTENGNPIVKKEITLTDQVEEIFSQDCDSTKWIMAKLEPVDNPDTNAYTATGYVVDPQDYRPVYQKPKDFKRFWRKEIFRMRIKKMKVLQCETVETPAEFAGQVNCWHVCLSMHEGRPVNGYMAIPVDAARKSLPIVLTVHGATAITAKSTQSTLSTAAKDAARGAIAMNINAHGMEDGAAKEYYKALAEELGEYQNQPLKDRKSFYFRLMYLREVRAVDFLTKRPEWDRKRIMVAGGSQGGAQSLAMAGIDRRVTHVRASVPAVTDLGGWSVGRKSGWPYAYQSQFLKEDPELAANILPYFDGAQFIRDFKGRVFFEVGFIDITCPPCAVYSAFNNARTPYKTIFAYPFRRHMGADDRYKEEWSAKRSVLLDQFENEFFGK